jgi:protein-tyrosine-phosphatase
MNKHNQKTILFLCTGNYYRSRFAEILFNSVAIRMGLVWKAGSRGLALERGAGNKGPMAKTALEIIEKRGIYSQDVKRLPIQVTREDFEQAERIIALKSP